MSLLADYDRPLFDLPVVPPFTPGSSPFRVAGVVYRGLFDFIESNVTGGTRRVMSELREPALARYIEQRFSVAAWYDATPVPYLGQAVARARGVSFEQQVRDSNRWSEGRTGGIYRALLALLSSDRIAMALPRAATIVHDFGKISSQAVGPRRIVGVRSGVPRMLVRWMALSHSTYLELALKRIGATSASAAFGAPEREGVTNGIETYRLPFELTWA